ncbi:MAG TPA: anion transporter [Cytophagales bacterium]|nr:anion transporter [Cytophagales bacterium]HAP59924.1 anion transporter [Cytophagales bacterium]
MDRGKFLVGYSSVQLIGLLAGPISFILVLLLFSPEDLSPEGVAVMATTAWVACWWLTEAAPMAATALLPIFLFPLLGALPIRQTTEAYAHPMIFLFVGGFILALSMEKWNLHRRIALTILSKVGDHGKQIVLGFMVATGFLSMWISNTATTVMMLPIGLAVIGQMSAQQPGSSFGKALLLGIAYSASIGGMATLVGTPTNPIFAGIAEETYGISIGFTEWFALGFPITILLIAAAWWFLTHVAFKITRSLAGGADFSQQLVALGRVKREEKVILVVFGLIASAWIGGRYIREFIAPGLHDTAIAIAGATVLFLWPSRSDSSGRLMTWEDTLKLPWSVLILFGGGLSIARGFTTSGLAAWIGNQLATLETWPLFLIILVIVALVNFLTEVTSNVATASMILPILAALATTIGVHPFTLMVGATFAASCAFMLPVATAPNAVIFGSGELRIPDMVRAGFLLNLFSVVIISLVVYFLMPLIWDLAPVGPLP